MDTQNSLQRNSEPFVSQPGSKIYLGHSFRELAAKLSGNIRRGAGVQLVTGAAGAGKTTLLKLLQEKFTDNGDPAVLLLKNPAFKDLKHFLITLAGTVKNVNAPAGFDDSTLQSAFNSFFLKLYQQEKRVVVLLIDNGQKMPDFCFQALQSFYDYHPDSRNFLQTVICGTGALQEKRLIAGLLNGHISHIESLPPFSFQDVRKFIRTHLEHAAGQPAFAAVSFTMPAQWAVFQMTGGQPQQTADLCRYLVLTLAIENRKKVDWFMVLRAARRFTPERAEKLQLVRTSVLAGLVVFMLGSVLWGSGNMEPVMMPGKVNPSQQETLSAPAEPLKVSQVVQTEARQETQAPLPALEQEPQPASGVTGVTASVVPAEQETAEEMRPPEPPTLAPTSATKSPAQEVRVFESAASGSEDGKPEAEETAGLAEPVAPAAFSPEPAPVKESVREPQRTRHTGKPVKPPASLGEITTAPGENFGDMVRKIYGPWSFNAENVKAVLALNPDIANPERLQVGDTIRFPAIPVALTPEAEDVWWARLKVFATVEDAYRFLRRHRRQPPPLLIVPSRDASGGLLMNVLLEEYFADKESAEKAIAALPGAMTAQAQVLHGLSRAIFYYQLKQED